METDLSKLSDQVWDELVQADPDKVAALARQMKTFKRIAPKFFAALPEDVRTLFEAPEAVAEANEHMAREYDR